MPKAAAAAGEPRVVKRRAPRKPREPKAPKPAAPAAEAPAAARKPFDDLDVYMGDSEKKPKKPRAPRKPKAEKGAGKPAAKKTAYDAKHEALMAKISKHVWDARFVQ